jgi:ribosomal protein L6P/L9E
MIYWLYVQDSSCPVLDQNTLSRLRNVVNQAINGVKPLFEERMKKLYEEYQKKLQGYGVKPIEIDGMLVAKLRVDVLGVTEEFEVELGAP